MIHIAKTYDQTRQREHTLSLLFLLKPRAPCAPLPASFLLSIQLSRSSGLASTEPTLPILFLFTFFPISAQVSPIFHIAYITLLGFLALLRPFSTLSPIPSPVSRNCVCVTLCVSRSPTGWQDIEIDTRLLTAQLVLVHEDRDQARHAPQLGRNLACGTANEARAKRATSLVTAHANLGALFKQ